jgi:hypothetical protein
MSVHGSLKSSRRSYAFFSIRDHGNVSNSKTVVVDECFRLDLSLGVNRVVVLPWSPFACSECCVKKWISCHIWCLHTKHLRMRWVDWRKRLVITGWLSLSLSSRNAQMLYILLWLLHSRSSIVRRYHLWIPFFERVLPCWWIFVQTI